MVLCVCVFCSEAIPVSTSQLCETIQMATQEYMEIKAAILRV